MLSERHDRAITALKDNDTENSGINLSNRNSLDETSHAKAEAEAKRQERLSSSSAVEHMHTDDVIAVSKNYAGNFFDTKIQKLPDICLTFAGDIMAHSVNTNMNRYDLIYKDVEKILHSDDLSFANVETPVCDSLPLSTYPQFNVHTPYLYAAANAGFDIFSFANNHANDQNIVGINGTLHAITTVKKKVCNAVKGDAPRIVAYSGLKTSIDEPLRVTVVTHKEWRIAFCAVTEILNAHDSSKKRVYYSSPSTKGRLRLLNFIKETRMRHSCDLFVLSLHLNEPEYVRSVAESKRKWFTLLGEAGVDIIWGHHPHVMQTWETISVKRAVSGLALDIERKKQNSQKDSDHTVFCMYSMGNFISGQRWHVNYNNPSYYREYTGDAALLQIRCGFNAQSKLIFTVNPLLITQYNDRNPIVKRFTEEWIRTLNQKEKHYFTKRRALMQRYLPLP